MDEILNYEKRETLYENLGCAPSSTKQQIITEFRYRVKSCHPDKSDDVIATSKYESLLYAYKVLSDDSSRKDYDKWLYSGLAIPYENWKEKHKLVHSAMHFAAVGKREKLSILENEDSSACARKEDPPSMNKNIEEKTEEVPPSYLKRPSFSSWSKCSKFRKYEI